MMVDVAVDGTTDSYDGSLDPRAERSRGAVLDAAVSVIVDEGWDSLTQNRVAQVSGVGRATVYRHWPDRVDLLRDALNHAADLVPVEMTPTGDIRRDLRRALEQLCEQLAGHGLGTFLATMVDRAERDGQIRKIMEGLVGERLDGLRGLLATAVASGELHARLDLDRSCSELIGPVLFRRLVTGEPLSRSFARGIVDDFLAAHS